MFRHAFTPPPPEHPDGDGSIFSWPIAVCALALVIALFTR